MTTRPPRKRNNWKIAAIALAAVLLLVLSFAVPYFIVKAGEPQAAQVATSTTTTQPTSTTTSATTTSTTMPTTTVPTTTPNWTQSTTTSTTTTAPVIVDPSAKRVTFKDTISLPVGDRWQVSPDTSKTNANRMVLHDTVRCGSAAYLDNCPGFVIIDMNDAYNYMPYDNREGMSPDVRTPDGEKCYSTLVTDGAYYAAPESTEPFESGGVTLRHTTQQQCGGPDLQHSWRSDREGIVIYDLDVTSTSPAVGVPELLKYATWK